METSSWLAVYVSGVIADILFQLGLMIYNSRDMKIYKYNLQKIGIIYNPRIDLCYSAETSFQGKIGLEFPKIIPKNLFFITELASGSIQDKFCGRRIYTEIKSTSRKKAIYRCSQEKP